ncbi:MAG: tRNA (adenosine(37)-N6)-threonylcarbamoyltransferase complex transferase subunit TsaD [Bacteriovoracia bacterium]
MKPSKILAIETSCDESAAAIVSNENNLAKVHSSVIWSQAQIHEKFGGVVPEVASRSHLDRISEVIDKAIKDANCKVSDLCAIAVTNKPGLVGALLVGVSTAKTLSYCLNLPLICVDHLEGHLHSIFIEDETMKKIDDSHLPLLACLVSGGHTCLYLIRDLPPKDLNLLKISESRDDAAGEAFDKTAKLLGLPYPGGILMDQYSKKGNKKAHVFPSPLPGDNIEFSFSGIKTAVATKLKTDGYEPHLWGPIDVENLPKDQDLWNYCASIQEAIVQTLNRKIDLAIKKYKVKGLAVVGGVSANSRFRELLLEKRVPVFLPNLKYCTDNAAMIGAAALFKFERNEVLLNEQKIRASV